jgi:pyruvate-ferredoxin/flavodoxin oxidoreductase
MNNLTHTAIRLYRQLFGTPAMDGVLESAIETVLDGNSAVAVTEAAIADSAVLGSTFPSDGAGLAWHSEQQRRGSNLFGKPLATQSSEGPRGAFATAMGLAMAGQRSTLFLSSQDLASAQDLLVSAAGRRLPLVIHLGNRALSAQGSALGSGHEALHQASDSGCFVLFASNVQQAADFTLIARRVAEQILLPGLVVMDGEQTALSAQQVTLLSRELAEQFLGAADERIPCLSAGQTLLFGEQRRRVPRWHDLDQPVLNGALQGTESYALSAAAQRPYLDTDIHTALEDAFDEFARLTGRRYHNLTTHRLEKAQRVLVVQGAAFETACAVSDFLRREQKLKLGVIGLHTLRPFPAGALVELLHNRAVVNVLERLDTPLAGDLPLMREIRSSLNQAEEKRGKPVVLHSAIYGIGGLPLRAADLVALAGKMQEEAYPSPLYLGLEFHHADNLHPKRQAMLDSLRRHYPGITELGLRSREKGRNIDPAGSLSVAVHRLTGQTGDGVASEAAALLHTLVGGQLRSQPGLSWEAWGSHCVDRFTHAPGELFDSGSDLDADIALVAGQTALQSLPLELGLRPGGTLILGETTLEGVPEPLAREVTRNKFRLYTLPAADLDNSSDALLGMLFGVLLVEGRLEIKHRRLHTAYEERLSQLAEAERHARLEAFRTALEGVTLLDSSTLSVTPHPQVSDQVPMVVRHLGQTEERYDSLPRFWDQVGVLYRDGETESLTADPYMATAAIPPLSATFRVHSNSRTLLPKFTAENCTGCGKCWSSCPDSAIGAAAIHPKALLDRAIQQTGSSAVRQIASKLASRIASTGRKQEHSPSSFGELLSEAFAWLDEKSPLPAERRESVVTDLDEIHAHYGMLPVSLTAPLFHEAEREHKESGTLISLAINPDSCKGCGLCIEVCPDEALAAAPQSHENLAQARALWHGWEQTPDTDSSVIERAARHSGIGPMAAVMLSRFCAFALSGGDGAEPGSGEKIALRQLLAATEYQQQPLLHRFSGEIAQLKEGISELIRETLAEALPSEDLQALAEGLKQTRTRQVDLNALTRQAGGGLEGSGVDAARLSKLVKLARELAELHWRLTEGKHGLGRARFGLTVAPGSTATWSGVFPYNPFQAPVTIDMTGEAAQIAAGLLQGQVNDTLSALSVMRRARAVLDPKVATKQGKEKPAWNDLTRDEQQLCPPLILVGSSEVLAGRGLSQVAWLLNSGLPVKIVVFSELDFGLASVAAAPLATVNDARSNLAMLALSQRSAYVAQSSIAMPDHMRSSMREGLKFSGPALINIHVPSPQRHGFTSAKAIEQAQRAVECRAHPLFRYNPDAEGVFGLRLELAGNPAPRATWSEDESGVGLTMAQWALSERRFANRLRPLHGEAASPTPLTSWVELDPADRRARTPIITLTQDDETISYQVDLALAEAVEKQAHAWRTLQELAGLVTPFTERVESEAREKLASAHQAELTALKAEYEEKIRAIQEGMGAEVHQKIRSQLMSLAGYDPGLLKDQ